MHYRFRSRLLFSCAAPACAMLACAAMLMLGGCGALGVIASKGVTIKSKPNYTGLKNQSVGIMVWAGRGVRIDYPALQIDIARSLNHKLRAAQKDNAEELQGTRFPPNKGPEAMYAFQANNPGIADSMLDIAPKLGVTRLIYIEVDDFALHPESVPELYRGMLDGRVQIIEVTDGQAKVASDQTVHSLFPEQSPTEGLPGLGDAKTYIGTVDQFTTDVLKTLVSYTE